MTQPDGRAARAARPISTPLLRRLSRARIRERWTWPMILLADVTALALMLGPFQRWHVLPVYQTPWVDELAAMVVYWAVFLVLLGFFACCLRFTADRLACRLRIAAARVDFGEGVRECRHVFFAWARSAKHDTPLRQTDQVAWGEREPLQSWPASTSLRMKLATYAFIGLMLMAMSLRPIVNFHSVVDVAIGASRYALAAWAFWKVARLTGMIGPRVYVDPQRLVIHTLFRSKEWALADLRFTLAFPPDRAFNHVFVEPPGALPLRLYLHADAVMHLVAQTARGPHTTSSVAEER